MADIIDENNGQYVEGEDVAAEKQSEIIAAYAKIAEEKLRVTMNDLIDAGYTKDTIVYYFRNLSRLNKLAREAYPESFFDVVIDEILKAYSPQHLADIVKNNNRFIVTTAVTGCISNAEMVASIENYCQAKNAHCLVLMASDPAHNAFAPGANYGTICRRLLGPHIDLITQDIELNTNLKISTVKLSAKHMDPATSMGRIASKDGTFIFASPKQRLKAIPVSNKKYPHFVMTTGAITDSDYTSTNYMSNRMAFLADHDHIMGGIIVEIENEDFYHFRQFQFDADGSFIDLGVKYCSDGSVVEMPPEAMVLGDWHAGATCPVVKTITKEIADQVKPNSIILHDLFDGAPVNHHEAHNVSIRSQNAEQGLMSLKENFKIIAQDFQYLLNSVPKLLVVKSNHDEFLDRFLSKGDFTKDHYNYELYLELALHQLRQKGDILKYAVETYGDLNPKLAEKITWLNRDQDYKIANIQLGSHGDLGANGSRGSARAMESAYGSSVTGHSHTPEILRGAWVVGTSTTLRLNYTRGPSSWVNTHCLVYPNGSRQLIHIIDGKWRLKTEN
jgi:hypothetical protein